MENGTARLFHREYQKTAIRQTCLWFVDALTEGNQVTVWWSFKGRGSSETVCSVLSNLLKNAHWQSVDDPNGAGTTTVNGINDNGNLVGFYVDSTGNTDGFLASKV